jgi:hypothetical protein
MDSREQRIATLATTLRSSGIAKSDSQAKMMAEDMIGVEEHVQKDYEVEHTRATEYLQTTKNLGDPRQVVKPLPVVESKVAPKVPSRQMEELYTSKKSEESKILPDVSVVNSSLNPEYTNVSFGGKTLNQAVDHDTHNSALEAIKAEISRKEFKSVDDIVPDSVVPQSMLHEDIEIIQDMDVPDVPSLNTPVDLNVPLKDSVTEPVISSVTEPVISVVKEVEPIISIPVQQPVEVVVEELPVPEQKLDAQKLVEMMEEDGKLEEHTREITEKPKDSKPKEAYEENNIDLSHMFDFNKGMIRK